MYLVLENVNTAADLHSCSGFYHVNKSFYTGNVVIFGVAYIVVLRIQSWGPAMQQGLPTLLEQFLESIFFKLLRFLEYHMVR